MPLFNKISKRLCQRLYSLYINDVQPKARDHFRIAIEWEKYQALTNVLEDCASLVENEVEIPTSPKGPDWR
jgi:hypothetical protein